MHAIGCLLYLPDRNARSGLHLVYVKQGRIFYLKSGITFPMVDVQAWLAIIKKKTPFDRGLRAGGTGVEPIHTDSESAVLPLDEPPQQCAIVTEDFSSYNRNIFLIRAKVSK